MLVYLYLGTVLFNASVFGSLPLLVKRKAKKHGYKRVKGKKLNGEEITIAVVAGIISWIPLFNVVMSVASLYSLNTYVDTIIEEKIKNGSLVLSNVYTSESLALEEKVNTINKKKQKIEKELERLGNKKMVLQNQIDKINELIKLENEEIDVFIKTNADKSRPEICVRRKDRKYYPY